MSLGDPDPKLCDHANECPAVCRCAADCYCKGRSCASAQDVASPGVSGMKFDDHKPRLSLLPWKSLDEVSFTMMYGAIKYEVGNWRLVPDAEDRYMNAAVRHLSAVLEGEEFDPESGLPHIAQAGFSVLCAIWFYVKRTGGTSKERLASALKKAAELRANRLKPCGFCSLPLAHPELGTSKTHCPVCGKPYPKP